MLILDTAAKRVNKSTGRNIKKLLKIKELKMEAYSVFL